MEDVIISQVDFDSTLYQDVYVLRDKVLRQPIGLSLDDEDLSAEKNDYIIAACVDDRVIGCLILTPKEDGVLQLRQMAIADDWQKKGIGKLLVKSAEQLAKIKECKKIILHARVVAQQFYKKLGYKEIGDLFTEVGIDHIKMEKSLLDTL